MSSRFEIRKFLQEEIKKMELNNDGIFYNLENDYDDEDNYYAELDENDRDSEFYENEYGNLVDLAEKEAEELADLEAEELADLEDEFYEFDEDITTQVQTELKKAKSFRLLKQYTKAIGICDKLLSADANNRYAIDLKIATLGDMRSNEAYTLAVLYMKKYATKLDFINTMFGLLQKMDCRKDDFVRALYKYCPDCIGEYINNLGDNNPKRMYLEEIIEMIYNETKNGTD